MVSIHTGKWFPFVPSWSIHIRGPVESSLMNVCCLVYPRRQRHNFSLHVSCHILLELHAMIAAKLVSYKMFSLFSLARCSTFTIRVKDGDNHYSFVCFIRLPIFKGQRLKMSHCEDMHTICTTENRWDTVELDLYCTCCDERT